MSKKGDDSHDWKIGGAPWEEMHHAATDAFGWNLSVEPGIVFLQTSPLKDKGKFVVESGQSAFGWTCPQKFRGLLTLRSSGLLSRRVAGTLFPERPNYDDRIMPVALFARYCGVFRHPSAAFRDMVFQRFLGYLCDEGRWRYKNVSSINALLEFVNTSGYHKDLADYALAGNKFSDQGAGLGASASEVIKSVVSPALTSAALRANARWYNKVAESTVIPLSLKRVLKSIDVLHKAGNLDDFETSRVEFSAASLFRSDDSFVIKTIRSISNMFKVRDNYVDLENVRDGREFKY